MKSIDSTAPTVFISYSHQDAQWKDALVKQLRPLEQARQLQVWVDTDLRIGEGLRRAIYDGLERADAAILLVSADYLVSCWTQDEYDELAQRGAQLIPYVIRPCAYQATWIGELLCNTELEHVSLDDDPKKVESVFTALARTLLTRLRKPPARRVERASRLEYTVYVLNPGPADRQSLLELLATWNCFPKGGTLERQQMPMALGQVVGWNDARKILSELRNLGASATVVGHVANRAAPRIHAGPGGTFLSEVSLATRKPFQLMLTPVTESLYRSTLGHTPPARGCEAWPVTGVSWHDAQDFCRVLNGKLDASSAPYRLPTVEEWQSAAGDIALKLNSDPDVWRDVAWCCATRPTQVIGERMPNRLGIFDLAGNVAEWTFAPALASGTAVCGGAFDSEPVTPDIMGPVACEPNCRSPRIGFRLASD